MERNVNSFNIEKFLDLTGYDTEERVSRRKNSKINSQEYTLEN